MKRKVSLILVIVMTLGVVFSLSGCVKQSDAPEGMQLAYGSDSVGYYFYVPEEWTVSNQGNIKCAYVSNLDTTSVTLVKTEIPEELRNYDTTAAVAYATYINNELSKMPQSFECELTLAPTECDFGKEDSRADKAYKTTYTYKYGEYSMGCMQLFITRGEDFYIMTYTSSLATYRGEDSYYTFHLEQLNSIITNFIFKDGGEDKPTVEQYTEVDGYYLVSNKALTRYDFYIPASYKTDFPTLSSSFISASREDGTTITMSEATYNAPNFDGYWDSRIKQLRLVADNVSERTEKTVIDFGVDYLIGAYVEYSYTLGGTEYKVYQALVKESRNVFDQHIFVYTYTATPDLYDANLGEAVDILKKVGF